MNSTNTEIRAEATGRITRAPELTLTSSGTPVCRFQITAETGPATEPVVKPIYIWGIRHGEPDAELAELARRCARGLQVGDRVFIPGVERQRTLKSGVEHALIAEDVKLRERGATVGHTA